MNPEPPQPSPLEQAQLQEMQAKMQERQLSLKIEQTRAETERLRVMIEAQKADSQEAKDLSAAMLNVAKAEAEETGTQLNFYQAKVDALVKSTAQSAGASNDTGRPENNGDPSRPV